MPPYGAASAVSLPATLPTARYNVATQGLHWLAALVILAAWGLGLSLEEFPKGPARLAAVEVHTLLGLTVLTLAVLRILSRLVSSAPESLGPAWVDRLARLGHVALYAVTVALPVSGLLLRWSARGSASLPGGWTVPAPFPIPGKDFWAETHEALAFTLAALVVGHVVAALWHQFVRRDDVLGRIVPGRGR
jgi:cytochrome b561